MAYVLLRLLLLVLLRCSGPNREDLIEQLGLRIEHRSQARSELGRIFAVALVVNRGLDAGQRRSQAGVSDLDRLQLGRREFDFAIHVFSKEFLDSGQCVLVALFLRARLRVLHAFDAGHVRSECRENDDTHGRVYAETLR